MLGSEECHTLPSGLADTREDCICVSHAIPFTSFRVTNPPFVHLHRIANVAMSATRLVGFATIMPWITADIHLLEYLAVAREHRGKNYGAALLQHITRMLRMLGTANGIILEVESDDDGDAAERSLRKRRIGFYKRNGAQVVECAPRFRVPSMIPGDAPLREKLMWIPLKSDAPPPHGDKLRDCITRIFTLDYGLAADDPLLQETLKGLEC